jgi:hypothetical protein
MAVYTEDYSSSDLRGSASIKYTPDFKDLAQENKV